MMFPFRGKEKQLPLFSAADDSRTVVHDFRLRSTPDRLLRAIGPLTTGSTTS